MADAAATPRLTDAELALFRAVRVGDLTAVRNAIARGVNINSKDERGRTALAIARERSDVETVRTLEAAGAR
jgi:ankyrin repeat protein